MADELDDLNELVVGQTYTKVLEFLDEEDNPIDINGSTFYFVLKDSPRNLDIDAVMSVSVVFTDTQDSSNGKGTFQINSDDWSGVVPKQYYWSATRVVTGDVPQSVYPHSAGKVNVVDATLATYA